MYAYWYRQEGGYAVDFACLFAGLLKMLCMYLHEYIISWGLGLLRTDLESIWT